jgi:DNA-binding transcriptional LysR family regulator
MELRHYKYFVALAEELNFRRAAARLHMEQPPLSRQIRQLEEELGVPLFHRNSKGVALTEAGQVFLEQARIILSQSEQATQLVQQLHTVQKPTLTIGFSMCAFDRLVPNLVQDFRGLYPDVEVRLSELSSQAQAEALIVGEIDCGFLHLPIAQPELVTETLLKEPIVVVLPKSHPLVEQDVISLRSLAQESFILCPEATKPDWYRAILKACEQAGFQPNVVQEITPPNAILSFVSAGAGIAFLTSEYHLENASEVVFRPLEEPVPMLEIAIAWHPKHAAIPLKNFLEVTRSINQTTLNLVR